MKPHYFETMVETITFAGIYREFAIPGFLRWCRISSIHSRIGILSRVLRGCTSALTKSAKEPPLADHVPQRIYRIGHGGTFEPGKDDPDRGEEW